MNDIIKTYFQHIRSYFERLSPQKRWGVAVVAALVFTAGATGIVLWKQDPYQLLYTDLQGEDGRAVTKKLGEMNIPYRAVDEGSTVSVPASQVANARMQLAKAGLPGQDVVGFEKFDGSTLGMSSYVQRIQYVRAMQGELTRSIQRLSAVKRARVHVSVPPKKTFLEDEEPPKASVVLELRPGQSLAKNEVTGIAHLVASAVEGLKVNQVTIVDTKGAFLHRPDDASAPGVSTAMLELQRNIENEFEKRVEDLLTPVVGIGKVRAKVTAEVDASRTNTTEETYDPEKAVAKSVVKNDEVSSGSRPNPIGIPGSRSNLPGAEPSQNPGVAVSTNSNEKNMSNTNFSIPRKISIVDKPSGNIKRLTVAVIVDGNYTKSTTGTEVFSPRTEEELKRIHELVSNAVGIDVERRDSLTVNSMPFRTNEITPQGEETTALWWQKEEFVNQLLRNALLGTVIFLFFFMVLRPFLKWILVSDIEGEMNSLPKTIAEIEAGQRADGLMALGKALPGNESGDPIDKLEEEDLRKKILERMEGAPKKGLRIVQDWVEDDGQQESAPPMTLVEAA